MAIAPALYFNLTTGRNTRFSSTDTLQANTIEAFSSSDAVTLFGNLGSSGTLALGAAGMEVTVPGDFRVQGTEYVETNESVTGNFSVDGDATLGSDSADSITMNGEVASNLVFQTSTAARTITGDGTNGLTVTAGASTALTLTSPVAATWSTTAGVLTLSGAGGATVNGNGNTLTLASAAGSIDADAATITIDGSTSVNVNSGAIYSDGTNVGIGQTAFTDTSWYTQITGTDASEVLLLTNSGANSAGIHVGSGDPSGTVSGNAGDIYLDVSSGAPYYCTGTTNWTQVGSATATGNNLDEAYDAFTGAATINVDTKNLTWQLTEGNGYDIVWTDDNGDDFLRADDATDSIVLGAAGGTTERHVTVGGTVNSNISFDNTLRSIINFNAGININAGASIADAPINISSSGDFAITASAGGGSDTGTVDITSAGNMTLTSSSGSIVLDSDDGTAGEIRLTNGSGNQGFTYGVGGSTVTQPETFAFDNSASTPSAASGGFEVHVAGDVDLQSGLNAVGSATGAIDITANGGLLTLTSTGSGITLDNAGDSTTYRKVVDLTNNEAAGVGASDASASIFVSSNDPNTGEGAGTAANAGDICLVDTGDLYVNTDGTATGWSTVQLGTESLTLQGAYDNYTGTPIVALDATGTLTWQVDSANNSDFIIQQDATASSYYLHADTTNTQIQLGSTAGATDISVVIPTDVLDADVTGAMTLDAGAASQVTTSSGALTLTSAAAATWSTTAGILTLDGAGGVNVVGNASEVDITTTGAVDVNGSTITIDGSTSVAIDSAGTTLLDSATGTTVSADAGGVTIDPTAGNIAMSTGTADDDITMTVTGTGGEISFTAHTQTLTVNDSTNNSFAATTYLVGDTSIVEALIDLDSAISGTGDTVIELPAGETSANMSVGDALYINSDGQVYRTDASAASSAKFVGFARTVTGTIGNNIEVYTAGKVVSSTDFSGTGIDADEGTYLYLDNTTAGALTDDVSGFTTGDVVLRVGVVVSQANDELAVQIGNPVEL